LGELLAAEGHEVLLVCAKMEGSPTNPPAGQGRLVTRHLGKEFSPADVRDSDIAIYPGMVTDNPLAATNVVRFLLSRPQEPTDPVIAYGATDFVMSTCPAVDRHAFVLPLTHDNSDLFFPAKAAEKEDLALIYPGRRARFPLPQRVEAFLDTFAARQVITPWYPGEPKGLAAVLRKSRVLVVDGVHHDICSLAALCNTPVFVASRNSTEPNERRFPFHSGLFDDPNDFPAALSDVAGAFAAHTQAVADNPRHIRDFVLTCNEHFARMLASSRDTYAHVLNQRYLSVRRELDAIRIQLLRGRTTSETQMSATAPDQASSYPPLAAQLFFDCGNGFNESDSVREICDGSPGEKRIKYDLTPSGKVGAIRFDPGDDPICLKLKEFSAIDAADMCVDLLASMTGNFARGVTGTYLFDEPDPQVHANVRLAAPLLRVTVVFEVLGRWQTATPTTPSPTGGGGLRINSSTLRRAVRTAVDMCRLAH